MRHYTRHAANRLAGFMAQAVQLNALHSSTSLLKKGLALNQRIPCKFLLFRYVPNVVRGEFVNIGVLIREAQDPSAHSPESVSTLRTEVRFTRDWRRVRALDPAAETDLLESLEQEIAKLLHAEAAGLIPPNSVVEVFSETLSNSIQITEPQATFAESLELEQLILLYVEPTLIE